MENDAEKRTERIALAAGLVVALAALGVLLTSFIVRPALATALLAQWTAQLALGKETGIPAGLAAGNDPVSVALAGVAQDSVILLVGYALILRAARGALHWAWLARRLPARAPSPRPRKAELIGIPLLALTLWIPFLPTGALVAAVAGRAAGFRPRILLPALLASITLSHAAYTTIYVAALRTTDARLLLVAAAAVAAATALIAALRARRRAPAP